jgi:hypothetical protein
MPAERAGYNMQPHGGGPEAGSGDGSIDSANNAQEERVQKQHESDVSDWSGSATLLRDIGRALEICGRLRSKPEKAANYTAFTSTEVTLFGIHKFAVVWNEIRQDRRNGRPLPESYDKAFDSLYRTLSSVRVALLAACELDEYSSKIDTSMRDALTRLAPVVMQYVHALTNTLESFGFAQPTKVRAYYAAAAMFESAQSALLVLQVENLDKARAASERTLAVLDVARQAAGEVGSLSLGTHFGHYAERERKVADWLRWASLGAIFLITILGVGILQFGIGSTTEHPRGTIDWTRLALALPLIALASYLGREASRHRRIANWAAQREVQLKTLESYAAPMSETDRQALRVGFGRRIFDADLSDSFAEVDAPSIGSDAARILPELSTSGSDTTARGGLRRRAKRENPESPDALEPA